MVAVVAIKAEGAQSTQCRAAKCGLHEATVTYCADRPKKVLTYSVDEDVRERAMYSLGM